MSGDGKFQITVPEDLSDVLKKPMEFIRDMLLRDDVRKVRAAVYIYQYCAITAHREGSNADLIKASDLRVALSMVVGVLSCLGLDDEATEGLILLVKLGDTKKFKREVLQSV